MIEIRISRCNSFPVGITASGHSGYAESGSDIVCAAVSVLIQALHIGLVDVLGIKPQVHADEAKAIIAISWHERSGEALRALAETVFKSLKATASSYSKYVKLVEVSL